MNLIILLGMMAYVGAVMTLPGIAGFILTIGIGVDSNVLIFERIKEELEAGKGVKAAINAGFSRVFLTLVDTHVAGFIAAAFLFQFGTGPIRGFAVTLTFGLDLEPLYVDVHFQVALRAGPLGPPAGADAFHLAMHIFKHANFNFLRWRWQAMVLSVLVIAAGLFVIVTRGIPLGVEFSGGTNLILRFSGPVVGRSDSPSAAGVAARGAELRRAGRKSAAHSPAADGADRAGRQPLCRRAQGRADAQGRRPASIQD